MRLRAANFFISPKMCFDAYTIPPFLPLYRDSSGLKNAAYRPLNGIPLDGCAHTDETPIFLIGAPMLMAVPILLGEKAARDGRKKGSV